MSFTIESAKQVLDDYYDLVHPQYEDDIQFINALEFLIQETNNPEYMVELGGCIMDKNSLILRKTII